MMIFSYRIQEKLSLILRLTLTLLCVLVFASPFYFLVINSFKSLADISRNVAAFPNPFVFTNFSRAWVRMDFPRALMNSLIVTISSLVGVILFSGLAAYQITRHPSKFSEAIYVLCLAQMIIPFQVIMIPLVVVLKHLRLLNSLFGLIFADWGLGVALGVFLFSGFIKNTPRELEEAAQIEGCNQLQIFFKIVVPLIIPVILTLAILDTFWFWNDYLLPVLIISDQKYKTLPIAVSSFMGQYFLQWDLALPALTMSIIPAALAFILLQKNIVTGLVAGAVKG